ncbi:hypothetical protein AQJ64_40220 [Streptomyces griseoruber]|uniref:Extensin n=1 Tax=Streptomyces griseoruber TaxID=1943 RepID=A0A101SL59_9ACTN|nr:hypothetical protein AQJ64_40220 [Streptomyces griseoruber]
MVQPRPVSFTTPRPLQAPTTPVTAPQSPPAPRRPTPTQPLTLPVTPTSTPTIQRLAPPTPPAPPRTPPKPPPAPEPAETRNGGASPPPAFDPRALTDFQLDELTHRLTGRITRLLRTELRLDRERIGRLRDPRH